MDINIYIKILTDTLIKKNELLEVIIELNKEQDCILSSVQVNLEEFDIIIDRKEKIITQLDQLDDGFEKIYSKIQDNIKNNMMEYKTEIVFLQEQIKLIMDRSINIQLQEKANKLKLESYLMNQKQEIKKYKFSSQTVSNYYKNMMNEYQGESYFLDKKK